MVTVTLTFDKKHLYFLSLVFGLVLGVFAVNAFRNDNTGTPSVFGHSVGEIDWEEIIPDSIYVRDAIRVDGGSILVRDGVWVGGQSALASDLSSILVGDLSGGDGLRQLVLRSANQDRVTINTNGDVGVGIATPAEKLDVNGNIFSSGKVYNSNACRRIFGHSNGGDSKRESKCSS